jgi:TonB-linked SusC/RagA family outer membrane protein
MHKNYVLKLFWIFAILFIQSTISTAQNASISGKVVDEKGEPVIGAAATIEGTTNGGATDLDGNYKISNVPMGKITVVVSGLGYGKQKKSIEIKEAKAYTLNIKMGNDAVVLKEAVVIGYGTEQKRDITGAISTMKSKEIAMNPVPSVDNALQGRIAGLQVNAASGVAGAPSKVTIRGTNSIGAGGQPLYVVDGIIINTQDISPGNLGSGTNPLSDINQNDIESIDVLKDAAAAAIYGSRGANGVILITTKKGKSGKTKFDFSYNYGTIKPTKILEFLNAEEHLKLRDSAGLKDLPAASYWNGETFTRKMADSLLAAGYYNDKANQWIPSVLRTGRTQTASLSASGGNDKTKFYISGSFYEYNSFLKGNDFRRFNTKIDIDNQATDKIKLGASLNFAFSQNNRVATGDAGGLGQAQRNLPYLPIYNTDGSFNLQNNSTGSNPLWQLDNFEFIANNYRTYSNLFFEYEFIKNLKWRSNIGADLTNQVEREYQFRNILDPTSQSYAWDRRTNVNIITSSHYLNYSKMLFDSTHQLTAIGGFELTDRKQEGVGLLGVGFSNDYFKRPGNAIVKDESSYNYVTASGFLSYFVRGIYKIREKYFINGSVRYDGSSRFGSENKYGIFPGASFGWLASEEKFIKNIETISYLKVRGGWGLTGNDQIGDFQTLGFFSSNTGYNGATGLVPSALANPNLSWEKAVTYNFGFEMGFVRNRIYLSADVYRRISSDLLLPQFIPTSTGYSSVLVNLGKLQNQGLEIVLNTKNIEGAFSWSTDFNIAFNQNKVISVDNQPPDNFDKDPGEGRVIPGYAVGTSYVVKYSRVAQQDGVVYERDPNGNIILDANGVGKTYSYKAGTAIYLDKFGNDMIFGSNTSYFYDQRVPRGSPVPKFIGGINNKFTYKGFELSFLFYFQYGNTIYDDPAKQQIGIFDKEAQRKEILNYWTPNNSNSDVPALSLNNSAVNSDRFLYDASFIRLRNVTLGYSFPDNFCKKIRLSGLRLFASGNNLLTFTKYPGWDPEVLRNVPVNSDKGNISFSGPSYQTPQAKSILFGVNFNF